MTNIFIDTNVLIDILAKREPRYYDTACLFELSYRQEVQLTLSSLSLMNAHYVLKKSINEQKIREKLHHICSNNVCQIVPLTQDIVAKALLSSFKDFEDATQYFSALAANSDFIITNNEKDFKNSNIPIVNATGFLAFHQNKNTL
jgi:predicted nucleic acid-binding protein